MSDRRRRSETLWNKKEGKTLSRWLKSEVNDDMMPGNHSGRPSWDPLQGNKNGPMDDDISRDRHRMQTDTSIDERGKQYSTRQSDDSYDMSYRSWDRGVGGSVHMSRDGDRPRSPYRSRNMSRSRSRSRSRNRDWESTRTRSRSPLCDDDRDRHESNDYATIRNNSRLLSRPCKDFPSRGGGGGNQVDSNNLTDSWSRRASGSRDDDYHNRDNRNGNIYDDQDRRRQSNRNSRVVPCRYFSVGKCNRDDCKFSHESGRSFGEKKKLWNGPSWNDADSGGFDDIQGHTSDDKSRTWDDKKNSWDGTSRDDVGKSDSNLDNKNRSWNGPSRDGASVFSNVSEPSRYFDSNKSWNNNASGTMSEKTGGKTKKWNGPLWDDVSESGYSDVGKSSGGDMTCSVMLLQTNNKIRRCDGPGLNEMASEKHDYLFPQRTSVTGLKSHTLDVQEQHVMPQALGGRYANATTAMMPEVSVVSSDLNNANIISEDANHQILNSGNDSINNMNSLSLSYSNGTEQSHHMLPFNGPKIQLSEQVEGTFLNMRQTENKNKEGGKPLKPSAIDVPQVLNDFNSLPVSLLEMYPKGQLPQLYTELSLPSSAYNHDTKPIEKDNSAAARMEVKTSLPMGIMSGLVRQENQVFPPILTDGHTSITEIGETGVMEKSPKTKKQELIGNPQGFHIRVAECANQEPENINSDKVEEGDINNDEKAMRIFKVALVEFVKEILKPKWKEGKMSKDVHKTVVKKVLEKVTSTIQGIQIPRTQAKIDQYLAYSKPKITKLVEAYVERLLKA